MTKPKPTLAHLSILKAMVENGWGLKIGSHVGGSTTYKFGLLTDGGKMAQTHEDHHAFWGPINGTSSVTHSLYSWGWTRSTRLKNTKYVAWYENVKCVTKDGRAYWAETGADLYAQLQDNVAKARAKVERLAIIKPNGQQMFNKFGKMRSAVMLVRIIRETDKRYYVEPVELWDQRPVTDRYACNGIVTDTNGQHYITRDQVIEDHASPESFQKLTMIETTIQSEYDTLMDQKTAEIEEINLRYQQRFEQKQAEWATRLL